MYSPLATCAAVVVVLSLLNTAPIHALGHPFGESGAKAGATGAKAARGASRGSGEASLPDAATLAAHAVDNDIKALAHTGMYLRYRVHKIDSKGDTVRDVIETKDGTVARLMMKNGRPLTPEENQAEIDRLNSMLKHPAEYSSKQKKDQSEKDHAKRLLQTIPQGLTFEVASPQEPMPGGAPINPNVLELTFRPNPNFQPPSIEAQVLKAMAGRVWIDTNQQQLVHLEVHLITDAGFGWGLLGKVYQGGSILMDQVDAGESHWIMTKLRQNLTIRALMVRTINLNVKEDISDFAVINEAMSYQDGIKQLEAIKTD